MKRYDIERYLNVRSAYGATFGADGERLAFLLDTTGVPQVWTLDGPDAWPEQRTFYDDRVTFAAWSPTRDVVFFGKDRGGDEREQLHRLDLTDGTITDATATPDAKHWWGGFSRDGDRFAFTSNRRDESVFDVYVQDCGATGDEATLVREGDGWLSVGGWSPDDSRLLVHQSYSNYDQDVSVLDLASGDLRHVTPHEGDVRYGSVEWGPSGDALYLTTDAGADARYLARLDLDTLALDSVDGVEADDGWGVSGVAVHQDTGRIVYTRNVDGYTDLAAGTLLPDGSVELLPTPRLPRGVIGGVDFAPAGDRFAVTVTGRTRNANVHVVDAETGESTRWTRAPTAGIPAATFVEPELIRFESFDGLDVPAFVSLPAGDGPHPAIVDVHGGPESQRRPSFGALTQYFLNSGYAVVEPNVRGSTGYGTTYTRLDDARNRMDAVADLDACVEWLAANDAIDADRIVAFGGSYGGFMVLAGLTEYPDRWAAGVDIVGIANFVTFLQNTGDWRRALREAEYGSLADDREFLRDISPINNIDRIEAPLLVLHGANDPRVPVGEAEQIAAEAAEHVPVETLVFDDEGHGFSKLDNRIEAYRTVVDFLDRHV